MHQIVNDGDDDLFAVGVSGGQRQAISLLMATIKEPKILLLDKHTSALDSHMAVIDLTRTLVAEKSTTTLAVTHFMTQALSLETRTVMMHEGRVLLDVSGPERDRLSIPELVSLFSRGRNQSAVDTDALLLAV
ncbi:hypothetical protein [Mesorhizobium sp. DCY119]|uniref:hypothetical protein n=1 Tax=Mesorhizobium sp. DCY119 TaxID=2108445 RepID=UPI001058EAC6|nr:hypothetical protein [Mesorhizobium sp. DCY119]